MATLQENVAATEFHRFPDLPAELRLMIWNTIWSMGCGPDVVRTEVKQGRNLRRLKLVVTRPQTVLLFVNRESRASTGLSKLELRSYRKPWQAIDRPKQAIYVDFQRDTFCIAPMAIHCLKLRDLARIRNAEVSWIGYPCCSFSWRQSFVSNKRSFLACTALERLILKIPTHFLGNVVITSEEPDWAERYMALHSPIYHNGHSLIGLSSQRFTVMWDDKLRELRQHFEEFQNRHPTWVPPKIILKFSL